MKFEEFNEEALRLIEANRLQELFNINIQELEFFSDSKLGWILLKRRYRSAIDEKDKLGNDAYNANINAIFSDVISFLTHNINQIEDRKQTFSISKHNNEQGTTVFLSIGTTHLDSQSNLKEELVNLLSGYDINLIPLDDKDWNPMMPMEPIINKIKTCSGFLALAMERFYVNDGVVKRGDKDEEKQVSKMVYATPLNTNRDSYCLHAQYSYTDHQRTRHQE